MNTKLIGIITVFLLAMSTAIAAPMPCPVYGHLTNNGVGISNIRLQYIRDDVNYFTTTNSGGYYMFELANVDQNYRLGDSVTVILPYCSGNPTCSETIELKEGGNEISFDVSDVVEQIIYVCKDGSEVSELSSCPQDEEPETEDCPTCEICDAEKCICVGEGCEPVEVCPEQEDCPVDESKFPWLEGIICLIIGAGVGSGVTYFGRKNYTNVRGVSTKTIITTTGKKKILHYHRGIRNYHDPKTLHRTKHERHKSGELYPDYKKDENGVYVYIPEK